MSSDVKTNERPPPTQDSVAELVAWLTQRAEWLRHEYLHGGNFGYLRAKEEECLYVLKRVEKLFRPIQGWILEAGELPSQDPANEGRVPRAMLLQFDTREDCAAVARGEPVTIKLNWVWDRPEPRPDKQLGEQP